jgi:adenosylcobinamide-phosphate synthase
MNFFAVLAALVIEQLKPLPQRNPVHDAFTGWMRWCGRNFDAGKPRHAWVVWLIAVAVPAVLAFVVHALLAQASQAVALLWSVAVLYVTLGFRQFSHYFTDIRNALERGDETTARSLLGQWRQLDASELPRAELLRHVLEHSLLAAHRHVFGVFFWFVLLSTLGLGPAGAVLYRMAEFARRYWTHKGRQAGAAVNPALLDLAATLFAWIDHVPARLTAFGFAVVGNFEDAVACWRRDAGLWRHGNEGVLLASAAGALGVQLGGRAAPGVGPDRAEFDEASEAAGADASTPGAPPQLGHLQSVVGLVWRSVVLWMLLLALLSLANLVG